MSTDGSGWEGEGEAFELPIAERPYGAKPYGAKPYEEGGPVEPAQWSDEICELVLARSAVVRLGATVVSSDSEVTIATTRPVVGFRGPGVGRPAALPPAAEVALSPPEWRLEAWIAVPNRVLRSLSDNPELSYTLKSDLADGLVRAADEAFLEAVTPPGIANQAPRLPGSGAVLNTMRDVVQLVRRTWAPPEFRQPGWILHPATLDVLTRTPDPGTFDRYSGLQLDGADGGKVIGFPFVTSPVTGMSKWPFDFRIYFAADWSQALVGIGERPVKVDTPTQPAPQGATVIRASMTLDFVIRPIGGFVCADTP